MPIIKQENTNIKINILKVETLKKSECMEMLFLITPGKTMLSIKHYKQRTSELQQGVTLRTFLLKVSVCRWKMQRRKF